MKEKLPELLIGYSDEIPEGEFTVGNVITPIDPDEEPLTGDNVEVMYNGGSELASRWVGWGIIRLLTAAGEQASLILHPKSELKLPKDVDGV